jgi:hypothetical protein
LGSLSHRQNDFFFLFPSVPENRDDDYLRRSARFVIVFDAAQTAVNGFPLSQDASVLVWVVGLALGAQLEGDVPELLLTAATVSFLLRESGGVFLTIFAFACKWNTWY